MFIPDPRPQKEIKQVEFNKEEWSESTSTARGEGFYRRRFSRPPLDFFIDYKDVNTLKKFLSDGRIVRAQFSRLNRKQQRKLTQAIKRAQQLALLPASSRHRTER